MPKYRVVARTVYHETSEPIEADTPEQALEKAKVYFDIDDSAPREYVEVQDFHEVYEENDSGESPPPTWIVKINGDLERWH